MKIFYYTFGCKVNQYETENIREMLLNIGYEDTSDFSQAEICVINTCTVTAQSDSKCRQLIHKIKKINPDCIIVLAGCFPQAFKAQAEKMTECDIIIGSGNKTEIPSLIKKFISGGERIVNINPHLKNEKFEAMSNSGTETKTRAYIKIQDGCDQYCTYCIIPFARGHVRSKSLKDIKNETVCLVKSGHKEIILTGINLCCYGRDLDKNIRLIDAIEAVCTADGDFRVRLSSIEPEMISDEDILRMARLKKLCPHFHLSLQSGCDSTLKRMNRHYDSNEYMQLCRKLRTYFPQCAITTDIMVGFPQESNEEFEQSLVFVKSIEFAEAHIFPYSRRPGTSADKMSGQIDKKTKHQRAAQMAEICRKSKEEYLKGFCGKCLNVLFERENSLQWHQGHAENYIPVRIKRNNPEKTLFRQLYKVKINSCDEEYCYGEIEE